MAASETDPIASTAASPPLATPVPTRDPELVRRLAADLTAAGYTVDRVAERLGPMAAAALHRDHAVAALAAVRDSRGDQDPLGVLVRTFVLGRPVSLTDLDGALPSLRAAGAQALGLVRTPGASASDTRADTMTDPDATRAAATVEPTLDLRPYADDAHDWVVASDLSETALRRALPVDHVLGIGGASTTLASWTPRRPVARALDLGTGCGVQALHLSAHAEQIVATDISERALTYAGFNADLADLALDLRRGNMLDPVAGERFDLVVSNPPFVITPRQADVPMYEYRDGGRSGDQIVRSLVRDIADHLAPGGVAQFLGNWEIPAGQSWRDVWSEWLDGIPLDAWVIQREVQDRAEYAELWARDGGALPGSAAHDAMYAAWLDDFAARDVEAVGFGVITLQRPVTDREPWRDLTDHRGPVATPMGPAVESGLTARSWLAEHSDDDLLAVPWAVAPDVTEERHGVPGAEDPTVILLRQGGGLGRVIRCSSALAAYVGVADGSLPAGVAIDAIATLLEVDRAELTDELLPVLRELIADGLLT